MCSPVRRWWRLPAGLILWVLCTVQVGGMSLLQQLSRALDGAGELLGMNGAILIGFLFALPANELAIPVILMLLTRQSLGTAPEAGAAAQLAACGVGREDSFLLSDLQRVPLAVRHDAPGDPAGDGESSVDAPVRGASDGRRRPAVPARQLARPINIKNTLHGCAACFVYESK